MIRVIVESFRSATDVNGNTYGYCIITPVVDPGQAFSFRDDHDNGSAIVHRALTCSWDNIHSRVHYGIPKRKWQQNAKGIPHLTPEEIYKKVCTLPMPS